MEAPALARIQSEYRDRNLEVIAVNVFSQFSLEDWEKYWREVGGGDVIYAHDPRREAIRTLNVRTAGATVIIDKQGRIAFKDQFATTYEELKEAVEKAQ
ncbi:MAG: TlpA family protein disulfide reductase [SAR324 cluster bacterium]|nr:TlpA family protein disulfide reductase [SAR324 cluster bacterium]